MRRWWRWVRPLGGAAILAVLLWRVGTGPFRDGVATLDPRVLLAGAVLGAVGTVCAAWRWSLVARGLGVPVRLGPAVAAYYRAHFLNTTLPGGILGDVHRAVRHGRDAGDLGLGLRAVAWERSAGQVVQVVLAVAVLLALPSPVAAIMPAVAVALAAVALALPLLARVLPRGGTSRFARVWRAAGGDLRHGVLARRHWPVIVAVSVVAVAAHAGTLLVAARAVGVPAPAGTLLPLALLVLLAMSVPTNIGGWGPREGVAAWVFGAAGLGAQRGVAVAVAYGVMVFVAGLPGAVVLVVAALRRRRPAPPPSTQPRADERARELAGVRG